MKYIDADLLRKKIEKQLKNVRDYMNGAGMKYKGPKYFKAQGKESAYDALLNTIDSLQQEQQEEPDKSLEEAADKYAQMMDEWLKDRDGCFWDGVNEGKKAMKDALMEWAKGRREAVAKEVVIQEGVRLGADAAFEELIDKLNEM